MENQPVPFPPVPFPRASDAQAADHIERALAI